MAKRENGPGTTFERERRNGRGGRNPLGSRRVQVHPGRSGNALGDRGALVPDADSLHEFVGFARGLADLDLDAALEGLADLQRDLPEPGAGLHERRRVLRVPSALGLLLRPVHEVGQADDDPGDGGLPERPGVPEEVRGPAGVVVPAVEAGEPEEDRFAATDVHDLGKAELEPAVEFGPAR